MTPSDANYVNYRWYRGGERVSGMKNYTTTEEDIGGKITVQVSQSGVVNKHISNAITVTKFHNENVPSGLTTYATTVWKRRRTR